MAADELPGGVTVVDAPVVYEPQDPTAVIVLPSDVPDGWEVTRTGLVEIRPVPNPAPTVLVEMPRPMAERFAADYSGPGIEPHHVVEKVAAHVREALR